MHAHTHRLQTSPTLHDLTTVRYSHSGFCVSVALAGATIGAVVGAVAGAVVGAVVGVCLPPAVTAPSARPLGPETRGLCDCPAPRPSVGKA